MLVLLLAVVFAVLAVYCFGGGVCLCAVLDDRL